jgi:hypothetical protein
LILSLTAAPLINAQDSLIFRYNSINDSINDLMTVPLYENYISDYTKSQPILYGIRISSFGLIPYTLVKMTEGGDSDNFLSGLTLIGTMIIVPSLGVIGGGYGYLHGKYLNELKKNDPDFHTEVCYFGHEFSYERSFLISDPDYKLYDTPKYSFVLQNFSNNELYPSEVRLGFTVKEWRKETSFLSLDEQEYANYTERKLNLDFLFHSNSQEIQFYYGFGLGYSSVEKATEVDSDKITGMFFYPLAGVTFNFNDYCYLRLEGRLELSEIQKEISADFGETDYALPCFNLSFGTYIF